MAEKDISQKTLESLNDVFSDIVNVLLFDGEGGVTMCDVLKKYKDETKLEIAEEMIKDGLPVSQIQKYTRLTLKSIEAISKRLNISLVM